LRAVNVAGHAVMPVATMRMVFEKAGFQHVRSYIQSGNILLESARSEAKGLRAAAAEGLRRLVGRDVEVIYRDARALERILELVPSDLAADRMVKLYVAFLARRPAKALALPLVSSKEGLEVVERVGDDLLIVSRAVKGSYGFPNPLVERQTGVPATSRNVNTVRKVVELLGAGG